jgi:hypothetical protein
MSVSQVPTVTAPAAGAVALIIVATTHALTA